jgi:transposase
MPNVSPLVEPKPANARSRVSNHRDLLPDVDGRSAQARRYRDILAALVSDAGGLDRLGEARIQLLRRFASIAVIAESMEAAFVAGTASIEITAYSTLTSTLVRLASRIGLSRSAKDITPSLADYLSRVAETEPAEPEDE